MPPIVTLSPSVLTPIPQNPRPRLSESEVAELRASIETHGQVQPCVVRPVGENGSKKYEVVIGHRRAFVGKLLGRNVPCLVEDLDDDEALRPEDKTSAIEALDFGEGVRESSALIEMDATRDSTPAQNIRQARWSRRKVNKIRTNSLVSGLSGAVPRASRTATTSGRT